MGTPQEEEKKKKVIGFIAIGFLLVLAFFYIKETATPN